MDRPTHGAASPTPTLPIRNPSTTTTTPPPSPRYPTIDGPLGLISEEESLPYARRYYKFGFLLLPGLWALNCFYFWPVLRCRSGSFRSIRPYVVRSAVGFSVFMVLLSTWAFTFAIGGEKLFGPMWEKLVMYNVAEELGLTAKLGLRSQRRSSAQPSSSVSSLLGLKGYTLARPAHYLHPCPGKNSETQIARNGGKREKQSHITRRNPNWFLPRLESRLLEAVNVTCFLFEVSTMRINRFLEW
ncbi:putative gamma-secretase subunit PEN-2 [Drosera capensis]